MDPDNYQQAWKAHSSETRVTIDADVLLKEVQRSQRNFRAMILFRDFREAGVALLLIPVWIVMGVTMALPWTWYLEVPACIWIAAFIFADRLRHPQKPSEPGEPLLKSVKESLTQVEHQIWLLRNILWWYIMPGAIPILLFFAHVAWLSSRSWGEALGYATPLFVFALALYSFIYYLNQYAVRKQLEPRRQELLTLSASLGDETTSEVSGEYPILMSAERVELSPRRLLVAGVCFVVILSIAIGGIILASRLSQYLDQDNSKKSPFAAVRWQESQPEVSVGGEWFKLVSLDDLPASDIVAFSLRTYGNNWQKRFEEDLVELLTWMGHPPQDTVTLVVQPLTSSETRTFEDVPMTRANHRAIRDAAQARERDEQQQGARSAVPIEEQGLDAEPHVQALESIRASYQLPAMAAFVMRDGVIVERATVGTRTNKDDTPVRAGTRWHLGGNTTAMTATLAGILVEEGLLQWDATLIDVLGDAAPGMDPGHRETTLAMLLHHTAGIKANIDWYDAPEDRVVCAAQILSSPPESQRGNYAYSNAGYIVAGAMMEVVTGKRWEDLMIAKLFVPLGMMDTSFGAPATPDAPWGHGSGLSGSKPVHPATRGADNAPVFGPAGTVHTTLDDYARFLAAHIAGAQGKDGIVTAETFDMLHTPPEGGDYAMGWSITNRGWAGGRTLFHGGSNTLWYATVWLAPEKDIAFFAVTNAGGDKASEAVNKAIEVLIGRHLDQRNAGEEQQATYPAAPIDDADLFRTRIDELLRL